MAQSDKDTGQAAGRQASDDVEYPQVAYVNGQCINIVASLWHTPEPLTWKSGAVARSNEEACMIAATAAWLRWARTDDGRRTAPRIAQFRHPVIPPLHMGQLFAPMEHRDAFALRLP